MAHQYPKRRPTYPFAPRNLPIRKIIHSINVRETEAARDVETKKKPKISETAFRDKMVELS